MRILIVEDEALIAMAIGDILNDAGHTVVGYAASRERAAHLAAKFHPELAIIDFSLADGETGLDLASDMSRRQIGTIMMSGMPRSIAATDPTMAYVAKPFTTEGLLDALRRWQTSFAPRAA